MAQGAYGLDRLFAGVDQVLGQGPYDPIAAGVDLANLRFIPARRLYDPAGGGVDDGGHAT